MSKRLIPLCHVREIPDPGSKGVSVQTGGGTLELFLVRRGPSVLAYRNRCPHTGSPFDWQPDRFLDATEYYIQCATHGALFRIEDGECLQGPCVGQYLTPTPVTVRKGVVHLPVPRLRDDP